MPQLDYHGASLVPDLSGSLRMALGIAQQREQDKEQEELNKIGSEVAADDDFLSSDNIQRLMRMESIRPGSAQFALQLGQARDAKALAAAKEQAEMASGFFQAFLTEEDPAARNRLLAETIVSQEAKGQDTSKLRELIGLSPDEQSLKARAGLIVSGDFMDFTKSLEEREIRMAELQGKQLKAIETQQEIVLDQQRNARAERADARAANADARAAAADARTANKQAFDMQLSLMKEQRAAAKEARTVEEKQTVVDNANKTAVDTAAVINSQINQALGDIEGASSGLLGRAAANIKPTGKTAQLQRSLETLKSMVTIEKLMDMKRSSPNGASGFGGLGEKEFAGLQNSLANLDYVQDPKVLKKELEKVRTFFSGVSERAGGGKLLPPTPKGDTKQVGRFKVQVRD